MGALHNLELPVGRHQEQNVVVKGQAIESDLIIRGERQKKKNRRRGFGVVGREVGGHRLLVENGDDLLDICAYGSH